MTNALSTRTGRCACGGVAYEAEVPRDYGVCHCQTCRRWAGGLYMAIKARSVRFSAPENILRWRSSEWGERGSCRLCGGALFWRFVGDEAHYLNVGTLNDQSGLRMSDEVFVDEQPGHYRFSGAEDRDRMTGAELMLKYGGGDAGAEKDG